MICDFKDFDMILLILSDFTVILVISPDFCDFKQSAKEISLFVVHVFI